jgi:hypothetical protein
MPGDIRTCPYCDVPLTLAAGGVAGASAIEPAIDVERARHTVETFLAGAGTPEDLKATAVRRGIELIFVPFFDLLRVQASESAPPVRCRVSVSRLTSIALENDGKEIEADRIDPDRVRATPSAPFDVADLTARGIVLEPLRSPESIRLPSVMSDPVTIERRVKVVYYPLWLARFSYGRSLYHVAVDGVTGEILRGVAPASMQRRVLAGVGFTLLFSVLVAIVIARPGIWLGLLTHLSGGGAVAAGGILLVLAAAWDRLRFRREVVLEGTVRRQIPINRPKETQLEALAKLLLESGRRRGGVVRTRGWDW